MRNLVCTRPWQNKANSRAATTGREDPILSCRGSTAAPGAQTKPIGGGHRAKQSQSGRRPVVQTKPICSATTTKSRRPAGLRRNKANVPTDRKGQGPARLPLPPVGAIMRNKANLPHRPPKGTRGQGCGKTKPISVRQTDPIDVESATVCQPHPLIGRCSLLRAKQVRPLESASLLDGLKLKDIPRPEGGGLSKALDGYARRQ